MKRITLILGLLRFPIDAIAIVSALILSHYLRYELAWSFLGTKLEESNYLNLSQYLNQTYWLALLAVVTLAILGMYSFKMKSSYLNQVSRIVAACGLWFMAVLAYYFFIRAFPLSRLVVIYQAIFLVALLSLGRLVLTLIHKQLLIKGYGRLPIIVLGNNKTAIKLINKLKNNHEYKLAGYVADKPIKGKVSKWLGKFKDLKKVCKKYKIETIAQSTTEKQFSSADCLDFCRQHHIDYYLIPSVFNIYEHKFRFENINGVPWLKWQKTPLDGWGRIIKRSFDLAVSIPLIIILTPLFLVIAIAIKIDSKGTIFFKYLDDGKISTRIGQKEIPFYCYKFRSMYTNTHEQRYTKLANKNKRSGPLVKIKDDPRITRIGKLLRRFDLDELPQLFNVLKGDMSIVGPRPHLPEEVAKYDANHRFLLTIKPGITGLAQVQGRSNLHFNDEVALDSYYIEHWNLWLDLKIIIKTLPVVLFKTND